MAVRFFGCAQSCVRRISRLAGCPSLESAGQPKRRAGKWAALEACGRHINKRYQRSLSSFDLVASTSIGGLLALGLLRAHSPRPRPRQSKTSLASTLGAVWLPGIGAALSSVGYCAILVFGSLLYSNHDWQPVWLAFTAFGVALIAARLHFGHLPDQFGGARIALLFVVVQAAGLLLMGLARNGAVASTGAALAGFGYSLVYPGFGVEAVRNSSPETRGMIMGIYTVFLDIAMAAGSPFLGWIGDLKGLSSAFIASAAATLCAAGIAWRLKRIPLREA